MLAALISSCGQSPGQSPGAPEAPTGPEDIARQTVADYLSIGAEDVRLVSVEARDFGDAGLGCPEPGMAYAMVITPGHIVIVEAEGRRFDVRVSGSGARLCRNKTSEPTQGLSRQSPADIPNTKPNVSLMTELARKDLAEKLGVPFEELRQLDIRSVSADNLPADCTPMCPSNSEDCGYLIGIQLDGRRYDYHGYANQVAACPDILTQ